MLFPTYDFLVFFVITFIAGSFLKPRVNPYKYFLLCANLVFYSFWSLQFLGLLVSDVIINYIIIKVISKSRFKQQILLFGIAINIFSLAFFKYYNFFIDSLLEVFNKFSLQSDFKILQIIVPIGISFYTFRVIAHLFDCYRDELNCPSFLDYAVYITYFPQVASGPIARANNFYSQLNSCKKYDYKIESVIILIISGLFKKYTLSSFLFDVTQIPFRLPEQYSSYDLILATLAYSCLIYVDFSGYSDLANAISSLLGFEPVKNFDMPYRAQSLQEFWRRWHISLSEWLRDYLYIPLGGSRKGKFQKYFNLFLTMVIGGIWHGAGLNFIIWGALHGVGLISNHLWSDIFKNYQLAHDWTQQKKPDYIIYNARATQFKNIINQYSLLYNNVAPVIFWLLTFIFVNICWIFFNTSSLEIAIKLLQRIVDFNSNAQTSQLNTWQLYTIFIIVFIMNYAGDGIRRLCEKVLMSKNLILQTIFTTGTLYVVFRLGPNTVPPFIYFNF